VGQHNPKMHNVTKGVILLPSLLLVGRSCRPMEPPQLFLHATLNLYNEWVQMWKVPVLSWKSKRN